MLIPFAGYYWVVDGCDGRIGVLPFLLGLLVRLGGNRRFEKVGGLLALGLFFRCGSATLSKTTKNVIKAREHGG